MKILRHVIIATLGLLMVGSSGAEPKTVRLLTIGNSFAENALTYLPQIVESSGQHLVVSKANLGGCTLERHWKHVVIHENDPGAKEGAPYNAGKHSLDELLTKEPWDFITIQQVSYKSHDLSTYHPFIENLCEYIAERAPDARIMAHQIWAYRVDDPRFIPRNEGKEPHTQRVMYEQVRKAYHTIADSRNLGIVPSGDAMYLADTDDTWGYRPDEEFDFEGAKFPSRPNQEHSLHAGWHWRKGTDGERTLKMDGHHASNAGKYLLGCVWFETFYQTSAVKVDFVPEGIDKDYAAFLKKTAHEAVAALEKSREP